MSTSDDDIITNSQRVIRVIDLTDELITQLSKEVGMPKEHVEKMLGEFAESYSTKVKSK